MTEVAGWSTVHAKEAVARLDDLTNAELEWVRTHESQAGGRVTVQRAAAQLLQRRLATSTQLSRRVIKDS